MRNTKLKTETEKGITLVALIITIVILMILAAVAIDSITGEGIIGKAESAKNTYTEKVDEEQVMLDYYEAMLAGKTWTQSGNKIIRGDDELIIGQTISYTPDSTNSTTILATDGSAFGKDTMSWRVLGVNEYGQLELISTMPTTDTLTLTGKDGYLNGPTRLNTLCNDLYKAEGKATARSLNVEDINKLANYTPAPGTKYTYKYYAGDDAPNGAGVYGIESNKRMQGISSWTSSRSEVLYGLDWIINESDPGPRELENTFIYYQIAGTNAIPDTMVTPDNIKISSLIAEGLNTENNAASGTIKRQWMASTCILAGNAGFSFEVNFLDDHGSYVVYSYAMVHGGGGATTNLNVVRPVVTLNTNADIVEVSGVLTVQ